MKWGKLIFPAIRLAIALRGPRKQVEVSYPNNPPASRKETKMEPKTVEVPVKSAAKSKINLTAAVAAIVALANAFGYVVPDTWVSTATTAISILSPILIIFFRTWLTKSITPASAKGM